VTPGTPVRLAVIGAGTIGRLHCAVPPPSQPSTSGSLGQLVAVNVVVTMRKRDDWLRSLAVVEAIIEAARRGGPVHVDGILA
jgi:hypothetical protein